MINNWEVFEKFDAVPQGNMAPQDHLLKPILNSRHETIFCNKHSGIAFVSNYRSCILSNSVAKNKNDGRHIEQQHRFNSESNDPVTNAARYSSHARRNISAAVSRKRRVDRKVFLNN